MKNTNKGSSSLLIIIIVLLLIIILGGGFYIITNQGKSDTDLMESEMTNDEMEMKNEETPKAVPSTNTTTNTNTTAPKPTTTTAPTTNTTTNTNTNTTTATNFNGNWSGVSVPSDFNSGCTGATLNVTIKDNIISGTGRDPISGTTGTITGTVSSSGSVESLITFGGGLSVNWSGSLSSSKGSGSWRASDGCKGTWSISK